MVGGILLVRLAISRWGDYPRLCGRARTVISRGRQRGIRHKKQKATWWREQRQVWTCYDLASKVEEGAMGKEGSTRSRERRRNTFFSRASGGSATLLTPSLRNSGLQNYERVTFCSFKPPGLWQFVIAALETDKGRGIKHWVTHYTGWNTPPSSPDSIILNMQN